MAERSKRRIAITGVAGYLGQKLVHALLAQDEVEAILGLDIVPSHISDPRYRYLPWDVRAEGLVQLLHQYQINGIIHLAWVFNPTHNVKQQYTIDVEGSKRVFEAAAQAGVHQVVYPSSTTSYGAHRDNPEMMTEEWPTRGSPAFPYSRHKAEVENWLNDFAPLHPDLRICRLRGCIIVGKTMDNFVRQLLFLDFPVWGIAGIWNYDPMFQFLHEDDVPPAFIKAMEQELDGPFVLSPDDQTPLSTIAATLGRPFRRFPESLLRATTALLWALRQTYAPPGYLDFIKYPWTASSAKFQQTTGWRPSKTTLEAITTLRPSVTKTCRV